MQPVHQEHGTCDTVHVGLALLNPHTNLKPSANRHSGTWTLQLEPCQVTYTFDPNTTHLHHVKYLLRTSVGAKVVCMFTAQVVSASN